MHGQAARREAAAGWVLGTEGGDVSAALGVSVCTRLHVASCSVVVRFTAAACGVCLQL